MYGDKAHHQTLDSTDDRPGDMTLLLNSPVSHQVDCIVDDHTADHEHAEEPDEPTEYPSEGQSMRSLVNIVFGTLV